MTDLRYVQVRMDDHNDLSDALGVERGALGWHELIERVVRLRAVADAAPDVLAQLDVYKRRETAPRRLRAALDALALRSTGPVDLGDDPDGDMAAGEGGGLL